MKKLILSLLVLCGCGGSQVAEQPPKAEPVVEPVKESPFKLVFEDAQEVKGQWEKNRLEVFAYDGELTRDIVRNFDLPAGGCFRFRRQCQEV